MAWRLSRTLRVLGLLALAAGCEKTSESIASAPNTPSARMSSMTGNSRVPNPEDGEVRPIDVDALDPAVAAHVRRYLDSGELGRDAASAAKEVEHREALYGHMPLQFGLIDGPLPDGASAVVVRMPAGPARRLIVFSVQSVTDLAFSVALHALREDERAVPEAAESRMLRVWPDQRVEGEGIAKRMAYRVGTAGRGDAALLLRGITTGVVMVPTLGQVRLVEDKP
jgi:hypothetical protein